MGPFPRGFQTDRSFSGTFYKRNKMFGDVTKDAGVKAIDAHLASNSYIEGYVPTQADTTVFDALKGKSPDRAKYPHAERWFLHIKSFEASKKQFPQSSKPTASYLGAGGAAEEDDDAAKVREQRLAAYAKKKAKKPALIAKTSV